MSVGVAAEIKTKLSVVDVVGETVQLKKAGSTYKGLCPFHGEKTPSFTVTPARESWKCFGCGEGGDIFNFVMKRDGLTLPRGAQGPGREGRCRARRADDPRGRPPRPPPRRSWRRDRLLPRGPDRLEARPAARSTTSAAAASPTRRSPRTSSGTRPGGWDSLGRTLASKRQVGAEELVEAGLAQPRQSARGGVYDRFRERVIFPIRDANGSPVGLGGRILEATAEQAADGRDRGPKYLNSPATPLFDKSRTLYLIDRAKAPIRKGGQAVIVEGYTDALMAHQAGFENVVASLGTALTPGQVALLTRYATKIALAYDVDAAGEKAGHVRRPGARGADRPAGGRGHRRRARRGPGRPPAGRQGSRRGPPRDPGSVARGGPDGPADRRLPDRPARPGRST